MLRRLSCSLTHQSLFCAHFFSNLFENFSVSINIYCASRLLAKNHMQIFMNGFLRDVETSHHCVVYSTTNDHHYVIHAPNNNHRENLKTNNMLVVSNQSGSRNTCSNMEMCSKVCGGNFKYKWRLLFCVVLHVAIINVLGAINEVDLNGYILYCPCMGKNLILAKSFYCAYN